MALNHKFDPQQWEGRRQKREAVRTNPGNENSVPALRQRIENVEMAIGLRPTEDTEPTPGEPTPGEPTPGEPNP